MIMNDNVPLTHDQLLARRQALGARQLELETQGCPFDPSLPDHENAKRQYFHQEEIRQVVREQLDIMAKMRNTASGPAKAGGKRAKRAPVDLAALEDSVFS